MDKHCKIDSLKVFIPQSHIVLKNGKWVEDGSTNYCVGNPDLYKTVTVNKATGEVVKEDENFKYKRELFDGTTVSFVERRSRGIGQSKTVAGVDLILNAKHLKHRYFEGLNLDNINPALDYVLGHFPELQVTPAQVIEQSFVSDIDFCIDWNMGKEEHKKWLKYLQLCAIKMHCNEYKLKRRNGAVNEFYFYNRGTATESKVFAKLYRKAPEYHNSTHQQMYFSGNTKPYADVSRWEVTMKNQKQLNMYSEGKCKKSKLGALLTSDYSMIANNVLEKYTSNKTFEKIKAELLDYESKCKMTKAELKELANLLDAFDRAGVKITQPKENPFQSELIDEFELMNEGVARVIEERAQMNVRFMKPHRRAKDLSDERKLIKGVYSKHLYNLTYQSNTQ